MKTQSLVLRFIFTFTIGVAFIVMVMMLFSSCKNETPGTPGTLQLRATTPKLMLKSGTLASVGGATFTLDAAKVEIKNLRVEENSGNDVQNQNGSQSGSDGIDGAEKNSTLETDSAGDIMLAGPYLLDILNGTASIDQVTVQPGTFKKVDFEFYAGPENSNHSIELSGKFTNAQGVTVPFTLTSDFAGTVQLPLAGSGLQVSSGGTSTLSILFDVNNWLSSLDLNTATQANGKITISSNENQGLYQAFVTELSKHIEIEN
jgi:hypothetical protein